MPTFTNKINIAATYQTLKDTLLDPAQLPNWDHEIAVVEPDEDHTVRLVRHGPAVNSTELLTITTANNQVIYTSAAGTVSYQIDFNLEHIDDQHIRLSQRVTLTKWPDIGINVAALLPVAKSAFMDNLTVLKSVVEGEELKAGAK